MNFSWIHRSFGMAVFLTSLSASLWAQESQDRSEEAIAGASYDVVASERVPEGRVRAIQETYGNGEGEIRNQNYLFQIDGRVFQTSRVSPQGWKVERLYGFDPSFVPIRKLTMYRETPKDSSKFYKAYEYAESGGALSTKVRDEILEAAENETLLLWDPREKYMALGLEIEEAEKESLEIKAAEKRERALDRVGGVLMGATACGVVIMKLLQ